MVRFIFVCMGITALSILSLVGQTAIDGITAAHQEIASRNQIAPEQAPALETASSETALNNIETAAGAVETGPHNFGPSFTGVAPAALGDDAAPVAATGF